GRSSAQCRLGRRASRSRRTPWTHRRARPGWTATAGPGVPTTPRRSARCSAPTPSTSTTPSTIRSGAGRRSSPTGSRTATRPGPTRAGTARCWSPATRPWPGATAATSTPTAPYATSTTTCSCCASTPTAAAPSTASGTCASPHPRAAADPLQGGCKPMGDPGPGAGAQKGVAAMTSLLVDVVRREPLAAADGRSGSLLERVVLADGEALVVKHVRDGGDWIMRASHDHARAAEPWCSGGLARVPEAIDHAVLGAEQVEGGWVVIMRDVSAGLVPDHARLTRDDSQRVLEAAPAPHARFWDEPPLRLCSMVDRYRFLSPATTRRE